jgi:uncharacterized protein (DUF433 family)
VSKTIATPCGYLEERANPLQQVAIGAVAEGTDVSAGKWRIKFCGLIIYQNYTRFMNLLAATIRAISVEVSMTFVVAAEPAPLEANADGVMQVGKTRVTLDTVIAAFRQGATAEEIVYRYPALKLADVYATIGFYLNHQPEVELYLQQRQQRSQEIRKMNEAKFDPQGLRDRLLARKLEQPT